MGYFRTQKEVALSLSHSLSVSLSLSLPTIPVNWYCSVWAQGGTSFGEALPRRRQFALSPFLSYHCIVVHPFYLLPVLLTAIVACGCCRPTVSIYAHMLLLLSFITLITFSNSHNKHGTFCNRANLKYGIFCYSTTPLRGRPKSWSSKRVFKQ